MKSTILTLVLFLCLSLNLVEGHEEEPENSTETISIPIKMVDTCSQVKIRYENWSLDHSLTVQNIFDYFTIPAASGHPMRIPLGNLNSSAHSLDGNWSLSIQSYPKGYAGSTLMTLAYNSPQPNSMPIVAMTGQLRVVRPGQSGSVDLHSAHASKPIYESDRLYSMQKIAKENELIWKDNQRLLEQIIDSYLVDEQTFIENLNLPPTFTPNFLSVPAPPVNELTFVFHVDIVAQFNERVGSELGFECDMENVETLTRLEGGESQGSESESEPEPMASKSQP